MAAPTYVQSATSGNSQPTGVSTSLAFSTQNNTQGNTLFCAVTVQGPSGTPTCSDPSNGSWTLVDSSQMEATIYAYLFVKTNCVGGVKPTVTVSNNGVSATYCMTLLEYTASIVDQHSLVQSYNLATVTTPTVNTQHANETLFGWFASETFSLAVTGAGTVKRDSAFFNYVLDSDNITAAASAGPYSLSCTNATNGHYTVAGIVSLVTVSSISGNAGVAGATVSWSGAASGSTTADGSGNYTVPNLMDGTYTITPTLAGYTFSPVSQNETVAGSNITGVNFTAILPPSVYSVPDCRVPPYGPNASRTVQATKIYDVQTSSNPAIPPTDSRTAGAPADCRISPNIPENSRTPGTFGPGE